MAHQHRSTRSWTHFVLSVILVFSCLALRPAEVARAANVYLTVDTTVDSIAPQYLNCTNAVNDCSLRGAIIVANTSSNYPYIQLWANTTYTLTLGGANEDYNATGDLDIRRAMSIEGSNSTINGGGLDRVFDIQNTSGYVFMRGLKITGGHARDGGSGTPGSMNGGSGASGGGIYLQPNAYLYLMYTTVFENQAGRGGDGMFSMGSAVGMGGSGGSGGGIYAAQGSTLRIESSLILNNQAGAGGKGGNGTAGINAGSNGGRGGTGGYGGGIYSNGNNFDWVYSRIAGNQAGSGGDGGNGGIGADSSDEFLPGSDGGNGGDGGSPGGGGGVYADRIEGMKGMLFVNNRAGNGGNGGNGGDGGVGGDSSYGGKGGNGGASDSGGQGGGMAINSFTSFSNTVLYQNHAGNGGNGGRGGWGGFGEYQTGANGQTGYAGHGGSGGALITSASGPSAEIDFSNILYNSGGSNGTGSGTFLPDAQGGGLAFTGEVKMKNTILYFNTTPDATAADNCQNYEIGTLYSGGGNFIEALDACQYEMIPGSGFSDHTGVDPQMIELTDAPTSLRSPFVLGFASHAVDAGGCLGWDGNPVPRDQREMPRHSRLGCDSGAYEYQFVMHYAPMARK